MHISLHCAQLYKVKTLFNPLHKVISKQNSSQTSNTNIRFDYQNSRIQSFWMIQVSTKQKNSAWLEYKQQHIQTEKRCSLDTFTEFRTLYISREIDFIRSPTTMKSPRVWTYNWQECAHGVHIQTVTREFHHPEASTYKAEFSDWWQQEACRWRH